MKFRIWSNEHMAWWRPNQNGYTQDMDRAGLYGYEEAVAICVQGRIHAASGCVHRPNETMVPETVE